MRDRKICRRDAGSTLEPHHEAPLYRYLSTEIRAFPSRISCKSAAVNPERCGVARFQRVVFRRIELIKGEEGATGTPLESSGALMFVREGVLERSQQRSGSDRRVVARGERAARLN